MKSTRFQQTTPRRVTFQEPLSGSIKRGSPRRPINRRGSPRPMRSTSSRIKFDFTSTFYDLSNIERLLAQNNIPFTTDEQSIAVDLINPDPQQAQLMRSLIDSALGSIQQQLKQLFL